MIMETFTPVSGFLGGILLGIAATLLLAANGRIAGISGIAGGLLNFSQHDRVWRVIFIIGLWTGALLFPVLSGEPLIIKMDTSWPLLIMSGLLVGFGTRLGSGCTSGHGICGIARFSKRSIVATLIFISSGMITVYIMRHVLGN